MMATKRRGHNEGTIKHRSDGRWEAQVSLPNGQRRSFYGKTRTLAQAKLRTALRDLDADLNLAIGRQTVAIFLDRWLEDVVKPTVRPKTHHSYAQIVRLHLIPILGRHQLTKLAPQHVQALLAEKSASGLSARTVIFGQSFGRRLGRRSGGGLSAEMWQLSLIPPVPSTRR